jgi:hypothetical protein
MAGKKQRFELWARPSKGKHKGKPPNNIAFHVFMSSAQLRVRHTTGPFMLTQLEMYLEGIDAFR